MNKTTNFNLKHCFLLNKISNAFRKPQIVPIFIRSNKLHFKMNSTNSGPPWISGHNQIYAQSRINRALPICGTIVQVRSKHDIERRSKISITLL